MQGYHTRGEPRHSSLPATRKGESPRQRRPGVFRDRSGNRAPGERPATQADFQDRISSRPHRRRQLRLLRGDGRSDLVAPARRTPNSDAFGRGAGTPRAAREDLPRRVGRWPRPTPCDGRTFVSGRPLRRQGSFSRPSSRAISASSDSRPPNGSTGFGTVLSTDGGSEAGTAAGRRSAAGAGPAPCAGAWPIFSSAVAVIGASAGACVPAFTIAMGAAGGIAAEG